MEIRGRNYDARQVAAGRGTTDEKRGDLMLQEGTAPSPAEGQPGDEDVATAPIPALKAVQERDLSRDVFDLFPFGIMVVDRGGQSVAVNEALRDLVALPADPDAAPVTCCALFG